MKKTFFIGNKKVGWLEGTTFRKVVKGSIHLFRKSDSWGIDYDVLSQLPLNGEIRLLDEESGLVYVSPVKRMRRGAVLRFKGDKGDFGTQVFLPRSWWGIIKEGVFTESEVGKGQDEMEELFDSLPEPEKDAQGRSISPAKTKLSTS